MTALTLPGIVEWREDRPGVHTAYLDGEERAYATQVGRRWYGRLRGRVRHLPRIKTQTTATAIKAAIVGALTA